VQSAASAATGSGPFGALAGTLFQLNAADYALALNELSGAGYAGYLQSFNSLGYHYNSVLDRASDCDRPVLAGSALACRTSPFHLWAQLDHDHLDRDGDSELAGDSGHRSTLVAGADVNLSSAAVVGISAGSVSNHDRFADAAGSDIKGDGWQVGAYGVYDPGAFFVKALGTYSRLDGTAHRHLDFGASPGTITGNPDATVWTLGLHGGYRLQLSPANLVTPFVSYDYTDAKLDGFTEAGTTGGELTVNGGSEKHSWLTGGVKWTGQFGGIVPEASVAWRHAFGDRRASFNANFAGSPATSDFDIVSMSEKHDALLAGVSVGGRLGPVDVRLAYQGAFGGGTTEHSGFLKLVLPFKAPSAAPRHASAAAPQPPQQQAATRTCADGTVMLASETCPTLPAPSATPL
jgi:outer membrane autotransporter protein